MSFWHKSKGMKEMADSKWETEVRTYEDGRAEAWVRYAGTCIMIFHGTKTDVKTLLARVDRFCTQSDLADAELVDFQLQLAKGDL